MIQASVLPEYFENFYARIGREPGSFLALIRTDGAVLAHFPVVDHDVRFEPSGPLGQQMAANPLAGTMTIRSPVDGIERRMRYERLSEYPIYVSAGLETSAIRARWINTMAQHLIFGIPATALLFGLLALATSEPSGWRRRPTGGSRPRMRCGTASGSKRSGNSPAASRTTSTICSP